MAYATACEMILLCNDFSMNPIKNTREFFPLLSVVLYAAKKCIYYPGFIKLFVWDLLTEWSEKISDILMGLLYVFSEILTSKNF